MDAALVWAREEEEIAVGAAFASWRGALREIDGRFASGVDALVVAAFEGAILQARAERSADVFDQIGECLARLIETAPQESPA